MIQILFVCLGNICRSTMAEAVMRQRVKEAGLAGSIAVDSAGTSDWHAGEPPHAGTKRILQQKGVSFDGILSRQLTQEDGEQFDLIIAMDGENYRDIVRLLPEARPRVRLLSDFAEGNWTDVPDPWFTDNFEETYRLVNEGCEGLLLAVQHQL